MKILRVLVFGATGVGKTSLCNALTGRDRPIDSGALGVTAKSHRYAPFEYDGIKIQITDTVGLHESSSGTVPAEKAILQLVELLRNSKDGFNLLIHVARASRITKEQEDDFDFFVNRLAQKKIPVLIALTGCENENPMSAWVDRNQAAFDNFNYRAIVPTYFASGGVLEPHFAPLRLESRDALLRNIAACGLADPVKLYGEGTGTTFTEEMARIWNEFVDWARLPDKYRRKVNESVFTLMRRLGVSEKMAEMAIKHIPDLVGELASKAPIPGAGKVARLVSEKLLKRWLKPSS